MLQLARRSLRVAALGAMLLLLVGASSAFGSGSTTSSRVRHVTVGSPTNTTTCAIGSTINNGVAGKMLNKGWVDCTECSTVTGAKMTVYEWVVQDKAWLPVNSPSWGSREACPPPYGANYPTVTTSCNKGIEYYGVFDVYEILTPSGVIGTQYDPSPVRTCQ